MGALETKPRSERCLSLDSFVKAEKGGRIWCNLFLHIENKLLTFVRGVLTLQVIGDSEARFGAKCSNVKSSALPGRGFPFFRQRTLSDDAPIAGQGTLLIDLRGLAVWN
jgi:hypothetical protein